MRTPQTILIVDDNRTNRIMLARSLADSGYLTLEACDGAKAIELAMEHRPSIILLDIQMPTMDGFEACTRLKSIEKTAAIPVLFLTSHSEPANIERAFAVGGCDCIAKPFHMGEVKARLAVHLGLREATDMLEETHAQLLLAQKMESIGQLAAGVAHEINTPTQFVGDNTRFLRDTFEQLAPALGQVRRLLETAIAGEDCEGEAKAVKELFEEIELDYILEEFPTALDQSIEGLQRVSTIVKAMKEFSHSGSSEMALADLNRSLETTINVASHEWKYVADVEKDFDEDLPDVYCHEGEIAQVLLNMIVNAAHALREELNGEAGKRGVIRLSTCRSGKYVEIRVSDTGAGIPEEIRQRIFDPFFTTKAVGEGTGQGLALAHKVVVQEHQGTISVESEVGVGTTFIIRLPLGRELEAVS
ncbi:MAG: response regulator [Planctomycetota bacterium]|nr:response regulator [Planctomycetota bacterium]